MRWHPLFIKWCLYLRHLSRASYEMLSNSGCIKLPSQQTLRDYTHYITMTVGFSADVDKELVRIADLGKEINKYVTLVVDEIYVKEDLVYDNIKEIVNLGAANNHLLEFEEMLKGGGNQRSLTNAMLVFMVHGLFSKLNYPYVQFACSNLSGDLMVDPLWKQLQDLNDKDFMS